MKITANATFDDEERVGLLVTPTPAIPLDAILTEIRRRLRLTEQSDSNGNVG